MFWPNSKNVPLPLYFSNAFIALSVNVLCGPSSNVIATIFFFGSTFINLGALTSNGALDGIFLFANFM